MLVDILFLVQVNKSDRARLPMAENGMGLFPSISSIFNVSGGKPACILRNTVEPEYLREGS